jgi:predicted nucleic acid-binding protein
MPGQSIFVDTWGWLAFGHRRDAHHAAVKQLLEVCLKDQRPVHTSDYVLDELITLLFRREPHKEALRFIDGLLADSGRGKLQIHRVTGERFGAALELRKRYDDKPDISFTDFTTVAILRELRIAAIVTSDRHFLQIGLGFETLPS